MADLHRRRPGAGGGYGDVFGGPPRYSGPFAARLGDYDDVFGGLSSSCSIPVLDLPPAPAAEAWDEQRSEGLDYFEIFGGFGGGEGVPTYQQLLEQEETAEAEILDRSSKEIEFRQQATEIRQCSPHRAKKKDVACLEKDQITSSVNHLNGNMTYHKPSQRNTEDTIDGTENMTKHHVSSGLTSDIDATQLSTSIRSNFTPNMTNGDISPSTSLNGRLSDQNQGQSFSSSSSAASSKSSRNGLRTTQKQSATKFPTSVDGPANPKHHSRSSSNHSTSSGDTSYPDFTYVSVSDISLHTQPVRVPPPIKSPPKLAKTEVITKEIFADSKIDPHEASLSNPVGCERKHSVWDAPKRRAPQLPPRDSSFFFDVEVDASSAAAASAAAMKEAMEQAQARLKTAKESMERKRDNTQSRKKLGHHEGTKRENEKEVKPVREIKMSSDVVNQKSLLKKDKKTSELPGEIKMSSDVVNQKSLLKKDKKTSELPAEAREKAVEAAKVVLEHERERLVAYEQDQQMVPPNGFISSQPCSKLDDRTGEWKTDEQFYELVHNEKKLNVVAELSVKKFADKVQEETIKFNAQTENGSKVSDFSCDFESKGNFLKVPEPRKREENDNISRVWSTASVEEKKDVHKSVPSVSVKEDTENKLEEVYDFHLPVDDESKLGEDQVSHSREDKVKKPNIAIDAPALIETDVKLKPCIDAHHFEVVSENMETKSKLEIAKEVCEYDEVVELSKIHVTCQPRDIAKEMKMATENDLLSVKEEMEVLYASGISEARDKVRVGPEPSEYDNLVNAKEKITLVSDQYESIKQNKSVDVSTFDENDLNVELDEEACRKEEILAELESDEMGIRSRNIKTIETVEWGDYIENKTTTEVQQDAEEQTTIQVPSEPEDSEALSVAVLVHEKKEHKNVEEAHLNMNMKEKYSVFNVAQEALRRVVKKDVEDFREATLFGKESKMLSPYQNAPKVCPSVQPEQIALDMQKVEEREKERHIEREERQKERKLDEEREREREREKDRIAVERATREAHERSFAEARERAERIAVERVTAEARLRSMADAREKAEKASAEALEKSLSEKASREARLRAERAAVERATTEARERAAEKAAADARERTEKVNVSSSKDRMRRGNETEEHSRVRSRGDSVTMDKQDLTHDAQYRSQRHMDSHNHGEGESALRCKARLERHQRTVERAAKALAERSTRDILAQREQVERNRLAEMLDADVRRWSTGKEGNLRALLSTLQYILGPDSGWQPIPLTDVITAAAVKKGYRKATLCVHPDKLQQRGANIQQKYICEKVFDLLKDAWNKFNSEER